MRNYKNLVIKTKILDEVMEETLQGNEFFDPNASPNLCDCIEKDEFDQF